MADQARQSVEDRKGATKKSATLWRDSAVIAALAIVFGSLAIPVTSYAQSFSTYHQGALAGDTPVMSSLHSNMTGGQGWAVTHREYEIRNIETSLVLIALATSSQGAVASFEHPPEDGYSICRWGIPGDENVEAGTTCQIRL